MNVWLITVGEPSPYESAEVRLLRTGMLAKELTKRGHDVTWWSSSFDHFGKKYLAAETTQTRWEGGELVLLHSPTAYQSNVSLKRIVHNMRTAKEFRSQSRSRRKPDVIVSSYPTIELSLEAVKFSKQTDVPIVVDVRDLWPDIFALAFPEPIRPIAKIGLAPFSSQGRAALKAATAIIGVSDGYLEWGLGHAARSRTKFDRVFPIGYEDSLNADAVVEDETWLKTMNIDPEKFIVWFVGSFGQSYDLETVVKCARSLELAGDQRFQFVICGDGEARSRLEALAQGLKTVRFTGWIKADQIRLLQRKANVGLMAYAKNAMQGLPNKLFEYIAAGIPVASSLEGEGAQFVKQYEVGLNFPPGDFEGLANCLRKFADDASFRKKSGANARNVFLNRFDSKIVYSQFASYIEEIATTRPQGVVQ